MWAAHSCTTITATNHDARLLIAPATTGDYFVDASSQVGADMGTYNVQALLASQLARPNDFNGDGTSDILWRSSAGSDLIWRCRTSPTRQPTSCRRRRPTGRWPRPAISTAISPPTSSGARPRPVAGVAYRQRRALRHPIDLGSVAPTLTVRGSGDFYKDGRTRSCSAPATARC